MECISLGDLTVTCRACLVAVGETEELVLLTEGVWEMFCECSYLNVIYHLNPDLIINAPN